jgi:hypothetical protein
MRNAVPGQSISTPVKPTKLWIDDGILWISSKTTSAMVFVFKINVTYEMHALPSPQTKKKVLLKCKIHDPVR